jgi:dGTPase
LLRGGTRGAARCYAGRTVVRDARTSEALLARFAAFDSKSRGRRHPEPPPRHRTEFQRDRDRIVHSTAFRRLEYKTQVFVNHEGDHYRTRLTHSLEVAQIGRGVARALGLNETLTEAICLAHDLGHTPFGHAGQDALNECMGDYGGFEHNLQSLRVVDELEERYAEFSGLNLCFETREGILKHCSVQNARALGDVGRRFLERTQPGLEAQLANVADEIAYNNHDVDDGLRAGLLTVGQLAQVPIFRAHEGRVLERYPGLTGRRLVHETVRRMIDTLVGDLIETSAARIEAANPAGIDDVRGAPAPMIGFSAEVGARHLELKRFLNAELYRHPRVRNMTGEAQRVVRELFEAFMNDSALLPEEHAARARRMRERDAAAGQARAVADYIAGMTDRYALVEHARACCGARTCGEQH